MPLLVLNNWVQKYWDQQAWENSVDPDQMLHNTVSNQVYTVCHSLQQSKGSKSWLFQI